MNSDVLNNATKRLTAYRDSQGYMDATKPMTRDEAAALLDEIKRLKEIEWMYEGLCK